MPRIEHFAIFADDLNSLRAFYESSLGLRVVLDNSQAPVPGYFLADEAGVALEIIERPGGVPGADTRYVCHIAFAVEDFDAACAALEGRGVRLEPDSRIENEAMRTAIFSDPEGNRVQIVWRPRPLVSR